MHNNNSIQNLADKLIAIDFGCIWDPYNTLKQLWANTIF